MDSKCIVIGGFNTGEGALEPLTNEAVEFFDTQNGECFSFRMAMYLRDNATSVFREIINDAHVLTHSAGSMALEGIKARPRELVVVAGPEPRSIGSLALGTSAKTWHAAGRILSGPDRRSQARVLGSQTAEAVRHPKGNFPYLKDVSGNSSSRNLKRSVRHSGLNVLSVRMSDDELFPLPVSGLEPKLYPEVVLDGYHDDLLVAPARLLDQIEAHRVQPQQNQAAER